MKQGYKIVLGLTILIVIAIVIAGTFVTKTQFSLNKNSDISAKNGFFAEGEGNYTDDEYAGDSGVLENPLAGVWRRGGGNITEIVDTTSLSGDKVFTHWNDRTNFEAIRFEEDGTYVFDVAKSVKTGTCRSTGIVREAGQYRFSAEGYLEMYPSSASGIWSICGNKPKEQIYIADPRAYEIYLAENKLTMRGYCAEFQTTGCVDGVIIMALDKLE